MVIGLRKRISRLLDRLDGERNRVSSKPFTIQTNDAAPPTAPPTAPATAPATAPVPIPATESKSTGPSAISAEAVREREMVQAPRLADAPEKAPEEDDGSIRIKAEVSKAGDECRFLTNRTILDGFSWWYEEAQDAVDSPLPAALFEMEGVESVLVDDSTVVVTRAGDRFADWRPMATQIGDLIREQLDSDAAPVGQSVLDSLPDSVEVETTVQQVIETEINPGVAAHSGFITLTHVRGNSVTISMGGGCQGCSAADVTLRQGIHKSFRDAMPSIGAIYDDTDHAAGLNPYFT
jgi:Fe-S cluster biogenesis protein NfuA